MLLAGVARLQPPPVPVLLAMLSHRYCLPIFATSVFPHCLVACRSSSAAARLSAVCCDHSCPVRLSCCLQVLLLLSHRPSLYCLPCLATAVLSICLVAWRCCTTSATARLTAVGCSCPVRLSCCLQVLYDLSNRPSLYCLPCVATSVFPHCLVACRC